MIVLDGLNTPFLDQAYGRKQLIKYLSENVAPGQVIGLVALGSQGVKVLSPPTTDSAILIAALKRVSGEIPAMQGITTDEQALAALAPNYNPPGNILGTNTAALSGPGSLVDFQNANQALTGFISSDDAAIVSYQQARAVDTTMRAFLNIAQLLSGIPGRKSLIWVTGGFPFYMDSASAVPGGDLSLLYERAMAAMNDAQIAVYPVDARGLVNYLPVADATLQPSSAAQSSIVHGAGLTSVTVARGWLQVSTISTLQDFAGMTGGRAFYNRNDLTTGFKRAADDSSSYYLLGFYLDSQNNKSGWRKLQVKVDRKDVEVRSRNGFFVTNATVDPTATHQLDISNALGSPLDSTGLPVSVTWQGSVADGDKKKVGFSLKVPDVGVINESDQNHFDLDFAIQASQGAVTGKPLGQAVKGSIPPEKLAEIKSQGIVYRNSINLAPGKYDVKFVVRDNQTGRVGSVTAPITVN
jgi:VWFA-related protein